LSIGKDFGRSLHPHEDRRSECIADDRQQDRIDDAEGDGGMNGFCYGIIVAFTERGGNDDAGADREPLKESDDQHRQRSDRADCSERLSGDEVSDYHGIGRLIELLKKSTEEDGKSEAYKMFFNRSCGHQPRLGSHNIHCRHLLGMRQLCFLISC